MFLLLDEYYKSNHSCFLLQYHLVLVTKYHHPRLTDGVKNILLQYARSYFEQCDCIIQEVILASVKDYHLLRLRGQRQRDTSLWNPLFRLRAGFGTVAVAAALCLPRQNSGGWLSSAELFVREYNTDKAIYTFYLMPYLILIWLSL